MKAFLNGILVGLAFVASLCPYAATITFFAVVFGAVIFTAIFR